MKTGRCEGRQWRQRERDLSVFCSSQSVEGSSNSWWTAVKSCCSHFLKCTEMTRLALLCGSSAFHVLFFCSSGFHSNFLHERKTKGQNSGQIKADKFVSVYSNTIKGRQGLQLIILPSTRGIKMLVTSQSLILIAT